MLLKGWCYPPTLLLFLSWVALSSVTFAGDGAIEINQAKALTGEVTPGDSEGFPVTISEPGSYRLTGNLTVPDENTTGMEVMADNVTIDLNGFAIQGPTECVGLPPVCDPVGSGIGISSVDGGPWEHTTVLNGSIRGLGSHGIHIRGGRIVGVNIVGNGGDGILVSAGSARNTLIQGNRIIRNGGVGLTVESSVVTQNVVSNSGEDGIVTVTSTVSENTAHGNTGNGIRGSSSTIVGNTSFGNGDDGISTTNGSVVKNNVARINSDLGLSLDPSTGYAGNVVSSNLGGTVSGGISMGENVCDGNPTCP